MKTRREYLASKGLAIAGARGKFSNEAKAELARVEAEGMLFSDPVKGVVPSKSTGPKVEAAPVTPKASDSLYVFPSDFRFPEDEYIAKGLDGKRYSMRECCNQCKVSLVNHACNTPTIYGDVTVTIVRK